MSPCSDTPLLGSIWDIKRFALHDGPGIRTTVFFKGCPLRCLWCCNPESQSFYPEILWIKGKCLNCDRCIKLCPEGAMVKERGLRHIDDNYCTFCGQCVNECPGKALALTGRRVTVDTVLQEIAHDAAFHHRSDGGLTLSGGEPLAQPDFAYELLRRYRVEERGMSTAIETCGYADWPIVARILEYTDLVLYDLKHMDSSEHKRLTGVGNERILKNAIHIADSPTELVIRFPIIPDYNDAEENIVKTSEFVRSLPGVNEIDILPYHRLGEPKYARLDRDYALAGIKRPSQGRIKVVQRIFENHGLLVKVGG